MKSESLIKVAIMMRARSIGLALRQTSVWMFCGCAWAVAPHAASAQFVEPGVVVLRTLSDPTAAATANYGWAVSELRDITGDGVMEVITSAPAYPSPATSSGRAYVYNGATGALVWSWTGSPGTRLGQSIADAGDVNTDGTPDIIVGVSFAGGTGQARIFSGKTGVLLRTLFGSAANDQFGYCVGGLDDVNGDGASDVIVGAHQHDSGGVDSGRLYVFSGRTGALIRTHDGPAAMALMGSGCAGAADLDGDGARDYIAAARNASTSGRAYVFSGATGAQLLPDLVPTSPTAVDLGHFFIAGAGDVNRDGLPDFYGGDFADGAAYVFSGLDGSVVHNWTGIGMGCGRGAGDVDGDGYTDISTGLYTSSAGAAQAGRVEVYSGRTGLLIRSVTHTIAGANFGFDAVGIGDVNGDCWADFVGAAATGNRVYIIAGMPGVRTADLNCDCAISAPDAASFALALLDPGAYAMAHPGCPLLGADTNFDGNVDGDDIAGFLDRLINP